MIHCIFPNIVSLLFDWIISFFNVIRNQKSTVILNLEVEKCWHCWEKWMECKARWCSKPHRLQRLHWAAKVFSCFIILVITDFRSKIYFEENGSLWNSWLFTLLRYNIQSIMTFLFCFRHHCTLQLKKNLVNITQD